MDNMVEVKKDSLRQMQTGDIKMSFAIQHQDMPDYLFSDPMGKRYYVVFVDADVYDESEGRKNENSPSNNEKTEGDKLRERACILCKDLQFRNYVANQCLCVCTAQATPEEARAFVISRCGIESRSELVHNHMAQELFKQIDDNYKEWLNPIDDQYADNISKL